MALPGAGCPTSSGAPIATGASWRGQGSDPGGAPRGHGGGSEPALAETRDDELLPPRSLPPYTPYLQRRTTRLLLHGLELGDLPPDYEARLREALQRGGRRLAGVYVRRVDDPAPPAAPGDRDQGSPWAG
ncbi:hypothetical protein HYH03_004307 [Edaphochlamys debaryana]|uniref:Uncharacterized protein n=1 Tax=Edaphochlamys debaryana TaxID=47281 RepID=A0A836C225_9CHLO|nr:hypothetical protein HYH03_004307 [Edaphochlamys debaryana]|eukprot:KAG2497561.1 hypothetical protein HYH03_004307 [Edaphochlamys debaryana]